MYMYEFTGTEIPEHATIETEEHDVGHCSSGFTVNYKPTKIRCEKIKYGQICKSLRSQKRRSRQRREFYRGILRMCLSYPLESTRKIRKARKKDLIFTGDGKALKNSFA